MPETINTEQVQGIVLSGYGHLPHAAYLFFEVRDAARGRAWLRETLPFVLSAAPWPTGADGRKRKPQSALNIAFAYEGLKALQLSTAALQTFPLEFASGMASRSEVLCDTGDGAPEYWDVGGPNNPTIHGLLMLYAPTPDHLRRLLDAERDRMHNTRHGVVEVHLEKGHRIEDGKEHFGFHDGVSQPSIKGIRSEDDAQIAVPPGEFLLGYLNAYGLYSEGPAVPESDDPGRILPSFPEGALAGYRDFSRNGSYLVYRKLAQDVAAFWRFIEEPTEGDQYAMIRLASKFFGRWPSGAPMSVTPDADSLALAEKNDFLYMEDDPNGYRCPIGAHIRRANPRDSRVNDRPDESLKTSSRHRLLRRGIPYGPPLFDRAALDRGEAPLALQDDGRPRGFQFFTLCGSITRQFEFVQQTWCNNSTFNAEFETSDPLVGTNEGESVMTLQACPVRQRIRNMPRFVTARGGEYFFMPGLASLRYLARDAA